MGTLRSASDCTGMEVNQITLGEPTFTDEIDEGVAALFAWDDSRIPNGEITNDGEIIVDESELI
jgi:hypothetical protein